MYSFLFFKSHVKFSCYPTSIGFSRERSWNDSIVIDNKICRNTEILGKGIPQYCARHGPALLILPSSGSSGVWPTTSSNLLSLIILKKTVVSLVTFFLQIRQGIHAPLDLSCDPHLAFDDMMKMALGKRTNVYRRIFMVKKTVNALTILQSMKLHRGEHQPWCGGENVIRQGSAVSNQKTF